MSVQGEEQGGPSQEEFGRARCVDPASTSVSPDQPSNSAHPHVSNDRGGESVSEHALTAREKDSSGAKNKKTGSTKPKKAKKSRQLTIGECLSNRNCGAARN